jgi:hypothetical protein
MANSIPKKRAQAATGMAQGAKKPVLAVKVPTAAKRAPAGLAAHRYPLKKSSLGAPQVPLASVAPLGRADK